MAAVARAYFNVDPVTYAKEIDKQIAQAMKVSKNKEPQVYLLKGDMIKKSDIGQAAGFYEQAIIFDEESGSINPQAYVKYANLYNKVNPQFAIDKLVELNEKLHLRTCTERARRKILRRQPVHQSCRAVWQIHPEPQPLPG